MLIDDGAWDRNLLHTYQTVYWVIGPLALFDSAGLAEDQCKSQKLRGDRDQGGMFALNLEKPVVGRLSNGTRYVRVYQYSTFLDGNWRPFTIMLESKAH
jgi:hypothetical protein